MVYISSISNKQRLNRYFIDINQPNQSVKNMIQSRILLTSSLFCAII